MIKIEKVSYHNWQNCFQISNPNLSLTVTTDVGPRILRFGLPGKPNIFYEDQAQLGMTGGDEWRAYGGHRFWVAPEGDRTYFPDNHPVAVVTLSNGLCLTPPLEELTGFQKSIQIELSPDFPKIHLTHKLTNRTTHPSNAAPWALTVMTSGGVAILPHSPRCDWPGKLTAQNTLSLWSYTDLSDPRWTLGKRYILLRQTGGESKPQKIGMYNSEGWAAYLVNGFLFIKFFTTTPDSGYPDLNSNLETWTNHAFLELETLGILVNLEPGQTITHIEEWFLFGDVSAVTNDDEVDKFVLPLVRKCQTQLASA
jgi:hypothetical protein